MTVVAEKEAVRRPTLVVDIVGDISAPAHDIMGRYDIMGPPVIAGDSDITAKRPMISLT